MALDPHQPAAHPFPESAMVNQRAAAVRSSMKRAGLGLGAITAGALLHWQFTRNR
jgi:hypothetical protein